jgi:FtsP/CotA-like multicopper oxidase with cupredoxin domain
VTGALPLGARFAYILHVQHAPLALALRALGMIAVAIALGGAVGRGRAQAPGLELLREFRGAYPAESAPGATLVEAAIEAAPAVVDIGTGTPLSAWAYNGSVPGPTIRLRLGQTLRATFANRLTAPSTIHWHGVRVPNAMDGVPGVTQPAVRPGETFVYEFTPKDAGTFWFHPHLRSSEQVERGLYGVLVVEDRAPFPYSRELTWVLDDWLLGTDGQIQEPFNTQHDLAHDGRWGNVVTVNGKRLPTFPVRAGERIRVRLLNAANGRVFAPDFSRFDGHVIAVDGMYAATPLPLIGLEMAPGNRLDLDLVVPRNAAGRKILVEDRFTRAPIPLAELDVGDAIEATPDFASPARAKVPVWRAADAVAPDLTLALAARAGGPYGIEWTLNDRVMRHEESGTHAHDDDYQLDAARFAKIRFVNDSARLHPMHIHGVFFKVLARGGRAVDERHWRDTVLVGPRETLDIGLVPLDIGRWMLHCHILEHAESGMMTLIDVGSAKETGS